MPTHDSMGMRLSMRAMRLAFRAFLALLLGFAVARANTRVPAARPAPIVGAWQGALNAGGTPLRIVFHVQAGPNGSFTASMDSLDQGAHGIPATGVRFRNRMLILQVPSVNGFYEGKLNPVGSAIAGTWTQVGQSLPLTLTRAARPPVVKRPRPGAKRTSPLEGTWQGTLNAGSALRIVFHFAREPGGPFTGTMDSPDQGARDIPLRGIRLQGATLSLRAPGIGGTYVGRLAASKAVISGAWSQGGQSLPLTLKREG